MAETIPPQAGASGALLLFQKIIASCVVFVFCCAPSLLVLSATVLATFLGAGPYTVILIAFIGALLIFEIQAGLYYFSLFFIHVIWFEKK